MRRLAQKLYRKGFSLLELMFVLIIIAGILIASVQHFRTYRQQKDFAVIQENVSLLYHQLDLYLAKLATEKTTDPDNHEIADLVNRDKLKAAGFWPKLSDTNLVANSDLDYQVGATDILTYSGYVHNLLVNVSLKLPAGADLNWYATRLHAEPLPNTSNTLQWQMRYLLKNGDVRDTGTKDDLWIMKGLSASYRSKMNEGPLTIGFKNYTKTCNNVYFSIKYKYLGKYIQYPSINIPPGNSYYWHNNLMPDVPNSSDIIIESQLSCMVNGSMKNLETIRIKGSWLVEHKTGEHEIYSTIGYARGAYTVDFYPDLCRESETNTKICSANQVFPAGIGALCNCQD